MKASLDIARDAKQCAAQHLAHTIYGSMGMIFSDKLLHLYLLCN